MLDVLVQLDGTVLRVAHTPVERRDAALGVQVHFGRAGLARQALGLGQQRGPEAAAARLGKHGQAAEHPATRLIGAVGIGEGACAADKGVCVVKRYVDGARIVVDVVELVLETLFLHEHACAYDARVIEVPMLESQFHAGPFSRRLLGHCTICAQRNGDYPRSCVCFLHNGRSSETRGGCVPQTLGNMVES